MLEAKLPTVDLRADSTSEGFKSTSAQLGGVESCLPAAQVTMNTVPELPYPLRLQKALRVSSARFEENQLMGTKLVGVCCLPFSRVSSAAIARVASSSPEARTQAQS